MASIFGKSELTQSQTEHKSDSYDDSVDTVVGPSVVVEGDFVSHGNIIVKGVVSGNVKTSQHLLVEEGAKITANVKARSAQVSGEIRGNVKVKDTLELTSTAKVLGDIECGTLIVAGGAGIFGKCSTVAVDFSSIKEAKEEKVLARKKKKVEEAVLEGHAMGA
jgi:cytoskeletal protein CcmA (bactofilin family)